MLKMFTLKVGVRSKIHRIPEHGGQEASTVKLLRVSGVCFERLGGLLIGIILWPRSSNGKHNQVYNQKN